MRNAARLARQMQVGESSVSEIQALRDMFEHAASGLFRSTVDGRILYANRTLAEMLGYADATSLKDAVNDAATQLYMDPGDRATALSTAIRDGSVSAEVALRHRGGQAVWVSGTLRVVRDMTGGIDSLIGTAIDVTDRREAEAALRLAKENSDLASRAKSEFLANMSHELRTPLNAIIGFSEIIKDELFGPVGRSDYVEYARDIHDSGRHLLDIINDILDVSKIEAGKRELQEAVLDMREVAATCARLVRARAETARIRLELELPRELPCLKAEELALKQVMLNLLSNAIKFTPEGGTVTLAAQLLPSGELELAVKDTGIGIAAEDIPRALAPFGQIDNAFTRKTAGTGLGLTLVTSLLRLHGGDFLLESVLGEGTTARARLPKHRVLPSEVELLGSDRELAAMALAARTA